MKLKYVFFFVICCFSFMLTENLAIHMKNQNPIMQNINKVSDELTVASVDSKLIDDLYIIPGLNGKKINKNKSFINMKELNEFSFSHLVYNQVKPVISLEDNKNRIIIRGNSKKNNVALIFESNNSLAKYLQSQNYKINILIDSEEYDENFEMINNASDDSIYKTIDNYLKRKKLNKNLCYVKDTIPQKCKNKYLFKPSLIIGTDNFTNSKNTIKSGEIILIKSSLPLEQLIVLIKQIQYQDLNIVYLSELISEIN